MSEWGRRLDDFARKGWHNRVQLLEPPHVVYVGLRRGSSDLPDRVTVRIDARLRDYVVDRRGRHIKHLGRMTETTRLREFWTLGRRDHRWILVSIEQGAEGAHALKDQIVATPWSDDSGLRDQAIVEQAVAEALPADVAPAEVASLEFAGDARAAALDLSLADGRFAPDVLEVAARRAVAAWTEAIDGDDQALKQIADPQAIEQLLYPGDPSHRTRLVVRGAAVKEIRITGLDPAASPPQMELEIELHGARYIEDRDTAAVIAGSQTRASSFVEHWTLALTGDEREPWRIVRAGTGALTA